MLGLLLFLTFVNDLPGEIRSYLKMFADDAKTVNLLRIKEECNV